MTENTGSINILHRWSDGYWRSEPDRGGSHGMPSDRLRDRTAMALVRDGFFKVSERLESGVPSVLTAT